MCIFWVKIHFEINFENILYINIRKRRRRSTDKTNSLYWHVRSRIHLFCVSFCFWREMDNAHLRMLLNCISGSRPSLTRTQTKLWHITFDLWTRNPPSGQPAPLCLEPTALSWIISNCMHTNTHAETLSGQFLGFLTSLTQQACFASSIHMRDRSRSKPRGVVTVRMCIWLKGAWAWAHSFLTWCPNTLVFPAALSDSPHRPQKTSLKTHSSTPHMFPGAGPSLQELQSLLLSL